MFNLFILFLMGLLIIIGIILGDYLKNKYKEFIDNTFLGFILLIVIVNLLPGSFSLLSGNYHNTTFIYLILMIVVGFVVMGIINLGFPNKKNINFIIMIIFYSFIVGFNLCTNIYYLNKIDYSLLIFNSLYNIIIGCYISCLFNDKKSSIILGFGLLLSILFGGIIRILFDSFVPDWIYGLIFCINIGMIIYFISCLMKDILKVKSSKYSVIGLVIGMLVVLLGVFL